MAKSSGASQNRAAILELHSEEPLSGTPGMLNAENVRLLKACFLRLGYAVGVSVEDDSVVCNEMTVIDIADNDDFQSDVETLAAQFGVLRFLILLPDGVPGAPHGILAFGSGPTAESLLSEPEVESPDDLSRNARWAIATIADPVLQECGLSGSENDITLPPAP